MLTCLWALVRAKGSQLSNCFDAKGSSSRSLLFSAAACYGALADVSPHKCDLSLRLQLRLALLLGPTEAKTEVSLDKSNKKP